MPHTPLSRTPYPSGSDAPAAAADMMAMLMHDDAMKVLPAVDEADRDARYSTAPASTLVASGQSQQIWMKTGPGPTQWLTVWDDSGWDEEGFVIKSGWNVTDVRARTWGPFTEIRGQFYRTGSPITAQSAGNITDTVICSVPPQHRPKDLAVIGIFSATYTSGSMVLAPNGEISIMDAHSASVIDDGHRLRFSISYLRG